MAIRVECQEKGFEGIWIDFRDGPWPFKDRRAMASSLTDLVALPIILSYIKDWNMLDVHGKPIALDIELGIDVLDEVNDPVIIPWIIGAWYDARNKAAEVSKN